MIKSGVKTTEFWLTLIGTVASSVIAVVVALQFITPDQGGAIVSTIGEVAKAIAALVAVLAPIIGPIFYNNGRAKVKASK